MQYNIFIRYPQRIYIGSLPVKPSVEHFDLIFKLVQANKNLNANFLKFHLVHFLMHDIDTVFTINSTPTYELSALNEFDKFLTAEHYKIDGFKSTVVNEICERLNISNFITSKIVNCYKLNQREPLRLILCSTSTYCDHELFINNFSKAGFLASQSTVKADSFNTAGIALIKNLNQRANSVVSVSTINFSELFYHTLDNRVNELMNDESVVKIDKFNNAISVFAQKNNICPTIVKNLYLYGENVFTFDLKNINMYEGLISYLYANKLITDDINRTSNHAIIQSTRHIVNEVNELMID